MNITKFAATSLLLIALGGCTTTAYESDTAMETDAKATSTETNDLAEKKMKEFDKKVAAEEAEMKAAEAEMEAAAKDMEAAAEDMEAAAEDMEAAAEDMEAMEAAVSEMEAAAEEMEAAAIVRRPLWNDRKSEEGPFDLIGDVHGCYDELKELLAALGYAIDGTTEAPVVTPPQGRRAIFLGDLVDRGPNSPAVLRLAMSMVESGAAICIPGNHEVKLLKKLRGKNVKLSHGLAETVEQLDAESREFRDAVAEFINGLVSHYVLDQGRLVVAHAGLREEYQGRASSRVRSFCLYGETTGETDDFGLPVRYNWAAEYRGRAAVVYGHTPVPEAEWTN